MTEHGSMDERRVVIAGGHGKIAQHLTYLLAGHGDGLVALIRNSAHEGAVRTLGAFPVVIDLESSTVEEVAKVLDGADVAVFAAGAGPGSSIERKDSVDRAAAVLLADAAEKAGVRRFIQISAMGAGDEIPENTDGPCRLPAGEDGSGGRPEDKDFAGLDDSSARTSDRRRPHR